jgi:hypothetical protein
MDGPFSRPTCRVVFRTLLSQRMRGGEGDKSGLMGEPVDAPVDARVQENVQ